MDFKNIITLWPNDESFATDISAARGEKVSMYCVQKWRQRNSIPDCFWADLIKITPKVDLNLSAQQLLDSSREKSLAPVKD